MNSLLIMKVKWGYW